MYLERIQKLQLAMQQVQMDHLIICDPYSLDYFIHYTTSPGERLLALLVEREGGLVLFRNRLFPEFNPEAELQGIVEVVDYSDGEDVLAWMGERIHGRKVGIDKEWPSHFLLSLMKECPQQEFIHGSLIVDSIRAIKSEEEQAIMRKSSQLNDQAMGRLIDYLKTRPTEDQARDFLLQTYKDLGASGFSFDPIIAYGPNGSDPHHLTDDSLPQSGDSVVIDIGCYYQAYASDMTRTVFFQEADEESLKVYETVRQANQAAIDTVRPGALFSDIDGAARQVIEAAGYGPYFTHRTGHFIGLDVHEAGDVGPFNHTTAKVGQIFSIEPGIYLPDRLGVRIEDLVLVTEDGCEVLNQYPKDLQFVRAEDELD